MSEQGCEDANRHPFDPTERPYVVRALWTEPPTAFGCFSSYGDAMTFVEREFEDVAHWGYEVFPLHPAASGKHLGQPGTAVLRTTSKRVVVELRSLADEMAESELATSSDTVERETMWEAVCWLRGRADELETGAQH